MFLVALEMLLINLLHRVLAAAAGIYVSYRLASL